MAKLTDFYGGAPADHGALAQVFAESMRSSTANAAIKAHGRELAAQLLASGFNAGRDRKARAHEGEEERKVARDLAAQQQAGTDRRFNQELSFRTGERQAGQTFEAEQAGLQRSAEDERRRRELGAGTEVDLLRILGSMAGAAGEQGYPVPQFMDRLLQRASQSPGIQGAVGAPPGGPGGYQIAPPQDSGYQGLLGGGKAGGFSDMKPVPRPPTVEEQRFAREGQIDQETMAAIGEATQFALSPQGQKMLYMPVKMSRLEALGLEDLPPDMQEAAVLRLFPEVAPAPASMDGEQDRSKLDAHLKWLGKEMEVEVPNESGFLQGRQYLAGKVTSPKALQAALEAIAPHSDMKPARTLTEARQRAAEHILNRMQEIKAAGEPAQLQGGGDLLSKLQEAEAAKVAVQEPQPAMFNKELVQELGWKFDQLEEPLKAAALLGFPIAAGPDGRVMFLPSEDGTEPPPEFQAALERQMSKTPERLQAKMAGGASVEQSPKELDDASTRRRMNKKGAASSPEPATPSPVKGNRQGARRTEAAPERGERPPARTQGMSAIDAYRASKQKGAQKPAEWTPPKDRPFDLGLYGLDEGRLLRLLSGAGGLR